MREIVRASAFKRDFKREKKGHHWDTVEHEVEEVIRLLANDQPLPERCFDHALGGKWNGYRDCHVKPDLVLIYRKSDPKPAPTKSKKKGKQPPQPKPTLDLVRLGSHAELRL